MSTRANDAEKKYLDLTAAQQSKSYYSTQKETVSYTSNDPKPVPKVSAQYSALKIAPYFASGSWVLRYPVLHVQPPPDFIFTLQPRSTSGSSISQAEFQKLKTELLEMRLLYTTTIEDYDVVWWYS